MKKLGSVFMAIGKVAESTEAPSIKRYIGVAPVKVLAVNPTKAELEKIYDRELDKEPTYLGKSTTNDGEELDQIRVDFIVRTDADSCGGVDTIEKVTFFLKKAFRYNRDKTKMQVVNKYGESTWLTVEDATNGVIPQHLAWFEAADFRPMIIGEEDLTGFIKAYLGIPNKFFWKNGEKQDIPNKADAECRLDCIKDYFTGNLKEINDIAKLLPNNKVKILLGVKTTDENKQYQDVFTKVFMKNNMNKYDRLIKELKNTQEAGGYSKTKFEVGPLMEYVVEATDLSSMAAPSTPPAAPSSFDDIPW